MPRQYTTRRERKRLWCAFFLLLALAAFLLWQELSPWEKAPAPNPPAAGLTLRVIDVGQAQSLLLTCGEDAILVDAGEYAAGGRVLAALSRAGVKSLTAAILTHPHGDHYGGMRTMLEKTPAAAFYTSAVPENQLPTTQSYEKLLSTLSEQAIPAAYLFAGDTIPLGDATVTVLSPARGTTWENLNNYSLVLRVTYGNTAFLLMGDAEAEVEETLLAVKTELAADVLVVGHHGSATSSSENFLKAVAPRYAILSVGEDNSYNLPNTGVLTRLKEQGAALYRTDLQGTVTVTSDGENLTISRNRFLQAVSPLYGGGENRFRLCRPLVRRQPAFVGRNPALGVLLAASLFSLAPRFMPKEILSCGASTASRAISPSVRIPSPAKPAASLSVSCRRE